MTADQKLSAILAAVQVDPGNRGLAELFPATAADFAAACRRIVSSHENAVDIDTGFFIPTATPPAFETDGPLGAVFLLRAFAGLLCQVAVWSPPACSRAVLAGATAAGLTVEHVRTDDASEVIQVGAWAGHESRCTIALERPGPAADGRCYSMRGRDITDAQPDRAKRYPPTIGIGDGGNEIGMGKLPHDLVAASVPNGDRIHCRVPADYLIVAGVSNWGAYALAAGVYVVRGQTPPADLFDPGREREILEVMVRAGPLVDGVTGRQTATVDGLTWAEYAAPLARIRDILRG